MRRILIIPAAGRGTRLGSALPKALYPVNGRPMIEYLLDLYQPEVDRIVLVLQPAAVEAVRSHCAGLSCSIDYAVQPEPTGMLDAVLVPWQQVTAARPASVWITWCDQVAVHGLTVSRLAALSDERPQPELIVPTARRQRPYTHFIRDSSGRITAILHRRDGDQIPETGESDIGLFGLSGDCYKRWLPAFAASFAPGATTGERNFLPFVPWVGERSVVRTFPCQHELEAVGVNDANDLRLVEEYLMSRQGGAGRR